MANTTGEQGADPAVVKRGELLVQQDPGCCLSAFCCCCFLCGPGTCPNAVNDRWQQCYIVLQQGALSVYVNPHDVMPADIINLYGSAVVLPVQPKVSRGNCIEVLTPKRSVFFCAASIADVQDWALAIQKAAIMETSGKLVVPPLLHSQYKHEASLHAAAAAAGGAKGPVNPHAALRAAQEAKYGAAASASAAPAAGASSPYSSYGKSAAKPQSIALSPRAALLGNEVRSDS